MTRWRVDFLVKSDLVLAKDQEEVIFSAPDGSHSIHLVTKRGPGKHAADELHLGAYVILEDDDPQHAADEGHVLLRRFLNILAMVTNAYYRIEERLLVADWTPGLTNRRFWRFDEFPDPNLPLYGLGQEHLDTVRKLTMNKVPSIIELAMHWWALGVYRPILSEKFQFFWYALEILAEHTKPTAKRASECPVCHGDLFCPTCNKVPQHRPYPKEAIKFLVEKHVTGQPQQFFALIDKIRNRLLHGDDPKDIERRLNFQWKSMTDALGKATWAALISYMKNNVAAKIKLPETLALITTNTFARYTAVITTEATMAAKHTDPENPKIGEFQPYSLKVDLIVRENPQEPSPTEN